MVKYIMPKAKDSRIYQMTNIKPSTKTQKTTFNT